MSYRRVVKRDKRLRVTVAFTEMSRSLRVFASGAQLSSFTLLRYVTFGLLQVAAICHFFGESVLRPVENHVYECD